MHIAIRSLIAVALLAGSLASPIVQAHGDVTPQAVDVSTLKPLGEKLLDENPYRGDKEAIRVGASAYTQNCARCHGLEVISGGMSPDLRTMDSDKDNDKIFLETTLHGRARNGAVYMPPFQGVMSQEAVWAIRAYTESRPKEEQSAPGNAMEALAKKSGCQSCHAVDARGVGPAFREVAKKYAKDKRAPGKLSAKLKKGAQGTWGKVPMPPVDNVTDEDLKALIQWILAGAN
jgi:cytochrome c-550 PedF